MKSRIEYYSDGYAQAYSDILEALRDPGNLEKWYIRQEPDEPLVRWADVINLIKETRHETDTV